MTIETGDGPTDSNAGGTNYGINITGHGWRKLMRAQHPHTYRLTSKWTIPPIFEFIQRYTGASWKDMFAGFNMGPGFSLIVASDVAELTVKTLHRLGCPAWIGGYVEDGPKQVIIEPYDVTFEADSMSLR